MEAQPGNVAKAVLFANGLRRNLTTAGRRWTQWPGGAANLAAVLTIVDAVQARIEDEASAAASIADLRTVLEWSTYQSAAVATARALQMVRKTRAFAERFGVLDDPAAKLSVLVDSEESLIENVRLKNEYMTALSARHPQLALPAPLVTIESIAPKPERKPSRLDLIQQLKKAAKKP